MKRIVSLLTVLSILITSFNILVNAEEAITSTAQPGIYTWNFISGTADNVYELADDDAALRVALGSGDSISAEKGIVYSGPSCKEKTDTGYTSAAETGRYILVTPAYSGKLYISLSFPAAKSSTKGRIWYNDFGKADFDSIDLTKLNKGTGTQIGSDFTDTYEKTLSFDVEAGHTYSLHTYVYAGGCTISGMYYESESIIGKTEKPTIKTPVIESDTSISGTCTDNAVVNVRINNEEPRQAHVEGTQWTLSDLGLNENDTISVTATAGDYRESDNVTAIVLPDDNICGITIADTANGTITTDQQDNSRVEKGTTVTLMIKPDDKYKLKSLILNGKEVDNIENNRYSFIINEDTEVKAVFEEKPYYSITMPQTTANGSIEIESGTIDDNGIIKAVEGDRVVLSVKPEAGYRIKTLTYTTMGGGTKEFKYGNFFDMPSSDVIIKAEFKKEDVVSYVDTSFDKYDRITLMVDGAPFFYNGVQVRPDNALNQLNFTYDQIKDMYLQAGKDGYTVVNSQIRWTDVQPDKVIAASETGYISGTDSTISDSGVIAGNGREQIAYITFNDIPKIDSNSEYAAVKLRLYTSSEKDTNFTVYGVYNGEIDERFKFTSEDWDASTGEANYHSVNVAEFVNAHKNDGSVTFAVVSESDSEIIISGAEDERSPQLKLSRDDVYDWTHLDKILDYAYEAGVKFELLWFGTDTCQQSHEERVPYYVHANYQKSLKSDGTPARNLGADNNFIMCKNDLDLRAKEKEVLETVFDHIADYTAERGYGALVVGCQVANETAVGRLHSGTDENKYFGHCYCDVCMQRLDEAKNESEFREETLWGYLNNLGSAVKESRYSVWTRENNYTTTDTNILAYNEQKRNTTGTDLDFVGLDPYSVTGGADHDYIYSFGHESCTYKNHTYNYAQGKNLPMVMEYGGNNQDLDESIMACIAGGGYMNIYELLSGKEDYGTYVAVRDQEGNATGFVPRTSYTYQNGSEVNWSEDNWIDRVRNMNSMLNKVKYQLATKRSDGAGGDTLMFFNPKSNETASSMKKIRSLDIIYNTDNNGVGIAIEESDKEIVLLSTKVSEFVISDIEKYGISSVETGYFADSEWVKESEKAYTSGSNDISIEIEAYECIKITVEDSIPKAPVIEAVSGIAEDGRYTWKFGSPVEAEGTGVYDYNDKYASIRVAAGNGDSLTLNDGVYWSEPSCKETDSAKDNNRYILIKPAFSGTVYLTIEFPTATNSARGRIWYNDLGTNPNFDEVDVSALKKGFGTQIGSDFSNSSVKTLSFDVEAGHTYSLHTYNRASYISEMYYDSEYIPDDEDNMPVSLKDISVSADGKLSASLVYNIGDNEPVSVIAAVYTDGVMESIKEFKVSSDGKIDFSGYTVDKDKELRLFVWDSLNGMVSKSRVYSNSDIIWLS